MTISSASEYQDAGPQGWRTELAHALAQPELAGVSRGTDQSRRAAYWLAVVLGHCRLRDLDLGDLDGTLPPPLAIESGSHSFTLLRRLREDAERLEERLARAESEVEVNDQVFDLLEARMEAWAAFVAIDEAYQDCLLNRAPEREKFTILVDELLDETAKLDQQLQAQQDLLALVAHYPLLENWRRSLGPTYAELLPWWLDGRLEATAAALRSAAAIPLPRRLDSPSHTDSLENTVSEVFPGWLARRLEASEPGHAEPVWSSDMLDECIAVEPIYEAVHSPPGHLPAEPITPPPIDAGQRLQQVILSWRGDERGQGAADLFRACKDAVGPGMARTLLPLRLLFVAALDTATLTQDLNRRSGLGVTTPLQFRVPPIGRFDSALVPVSRSGQAPDRWLQALDADLKPREQVALFAHAVAHFLFDREQVRMGFVRQLDPRDGRTHCDVLAELRLGENARQPLDRRVLDAFPLLADLLQSREETPVSQTAVTESLKKQLAASGWRGARYVTPGFRFSDGRIYPGEDGQPRRGRPGFADALLRAEASLPLAVAQRLRPNQTPEDGERWLASTAHERLLLPFAYLFPHDGSIVELERNGPGHPRRRTVEHVPEPKQLLSRWLQGLKLDDEEAHAVLTCPYGSPVDQLPRYYQEAAINRAVAAVLMARRGHRKPRILINLATGTGKTKVAFEIVWKLKRKRAIKNMLFLTDRDYLLEQAKDADFSPFGDARARVLGERETARDILFGTYQALAGNSERAGVFREYPPTYFDLIIVDECHRGSAGDESEWREILTYFDSAVQIGLTATPRNDDNVVTFDYFGEPIITYSLKQGINDGYLAPYSVRRVLLREVAQSAEGEPTATPPASAVQEVESRQTMLDSTEAIAGHLARYLYETDPWAKTIVFCVDMPHAQTMRDAIEARCAELGIGGEGYVERIVSEEGTEGRRSLGRFKDPEQRLPVVVTTSKLLSTGVDIRTCKNIVLARPVGSIIEFKQIIGRGTRLYEPKKSWFTILDYAGATNHFHDPDFDGYADSVAVESLFPQPEVSREPEPPALPTPEESGPDVLGAVPATQTAPPGTPVVTTPVPPVEAGTETPALPTPVTPSVQPGPPAGLEHVPAPSPAVPPPALPESPATTPETPGSAPPSTPGRDIPPAPESSALPPGLPRQPPSWGKRRVRPRDGVQMVVVKEIVYELGPDGITLREVPYFDYAREAIGHLCHSLTELRQHWLQPEARRELQELLTNAGVDVAELGAALNVPDSDPLDVLTRALFRQPVPTRRERADRLRQQHGEWLQSFAEPARAVLEAVLEKYVAGEADDVADTALLRVPPLNEWGTFMELAARFGGGPALRQALAELKQHLYDE